MSIKFTDFSEIGIGGEQRGDYLNSVDPSKLLDDPRFHDDLREYYAMNGKRFENKDDMIRQWYDDRTYAELNVSFGTSGDVLDTYNSNLQERELKKRLVGAYQKMPFFFQDGGMGDKDGFQVAKSIGKAILTDPLNLIGPFAAVGKIGQAARVAAIAGKNTSWAATKAGAKAGAIAEAKYGAPIEALADSAVQARDMQLGLQDEYSVGQAATAGLVGGALSGGLGAIGGGAMGAFRGNKLARGLQEEEIANTMMNRPEIMGPEEGAPKLLNDLAANEEIILNEQAKTQNQNALDEERFLNSTATPDADLDDEVPIARPERIDVDAINARYNETSEVLRRANADGDQDEIDDAVASHKRSAILRGLATRISNESGEIEALLGSNVQGEINTGAQRDSNLTTVIGWYEELIKEDPYSPRSEELIGDINDKLLDSNKAKAKADATQSQTTATQAATQTENPGEDTATPVIQTEEIINEQPDVALVTPEPSAEVPTTAPTTAPTTETILPLEEIELLDMTTEVKDGKDGSTQYAPAPVVYKRLTDRVDRLQKFRACIGG